MNELIALESQEEVIQRFGKDGSHAHLRKRLSHYGAVRWDVLAAFSSWPLEKYCRWQSAAGVWYVDCGNWNYCNILNGQCGILYSTSNQRIRNAVTMCGEKMADIVEAILGAWVLMAGVDENPLLLEGVESMGLSETAWNTWHECLERLHNCCVHAGQRGIIWSACARNSGMSSE